MENKFDVLIKEEWEKFSFENAVFLPNIMLLGATGCGKSSLINLVFNKDIAYVKPISRGTEGFETYYGQDYGMGVNLIDSRGYEMEEGNGESIFSTPYYQSVQKEIQKSLQRDPLEKIHIIWYCVSVAAHKIQDFDIEILKLLRNTPELRKRVIVVLTKCDQDDVKGKTAKAIKREIIKGIGRDVEIFEVSNKPNVKLDLEKLIDLSANLLDNKDLRDAFVASQVVSLHAKQKTAISKIGFYAAVAAGIAVIPIPVADTLALVPLQVKMSKDIVHIYGLDSLDNIAQTVVGESIISNLGKLFARKLTEFIPVIGGIIDAAVASLLTGTLGWAISEICFTSCKKIAEGQHVDFNEIFDVEEIEKYMDQYKKHHNHQKTVEKESKSVDKEKVEEEAEKYEKYKEEKEA